MGLSGSGKLPGAEDSKATIKHKRKRIMISSKVEDHPALAVE